MLSHYPRSPVLWKLCEGLAIAHCAQFLQAVSSRRVVNPEFELFPEQIATELETTLTDLPFQCVEYLKIEKQREMIFLFFFLYKKNDNHIRLVYLAVPLS